MNDFHSAFWGYYIAIPSILGILGVCWLMLAFSKRPSSTDPVGDTGHSWDGDLREMNNPLPRWWINLFFISVVFSFGYLILYPGLVVTEGGVLGFSSAKEVETDQAALQAQAKVVLDKYAKMDVKQIAADPEAHAIGQKAFLNYCSQCHGSDAGGAYGFPSLADKDWLWGGEPEQITETILNGRNGVMPALGEVIKGAEVVAVANYVRKLANLKHDEVQATQGQASFEANCAACHQVDGTGNPALGAPNLAHPSGKWLYDNSVEEIGYGITHGRNNMMPAHKDILSPELVPLLTAYVWGLSNKAAK